MKYYIKKEWKLNLLVFLFQTIWAGISVLHNVLMMKSFQGIIEMNLRMFLFWELIDMGLWLVYLGADCARNWAKAKAKRSMNNLVRADFVASLLKKDHRTFHSQQSGEYLSWLSNDITQIEHLAWDSFYGLISVGAQVIFSIFALTKLHWSLFVLSILVGILSINAPKLVRKRLETLSENTAREQGLAMGKMKDLLAGMDVLNAFGYRNRFTKDNQQASDQMEKSKYELTITRNFIENGISLISIVCQFAVNLAMGVMSIQGIILQSALFGGGNLCSTVANGLSSLAQQRVSILASKPYFDKITVHAEDLPEDRSPAASMEDSITVENLSFSYGDKPILEGSDFRFEKGGKYALTGPSGCGKSTLLKLLLGWLPDYSGTIRFDSTDARDYTPHQLQQGMSYIEQDVFLFNTTIRDNITLGGSFTEEQMDRAIRGSALDGDLARMPLGLDTPVGEDGSSLSGGQKQRIAIARALIHDRSILLIDEGTSALDQKNADIVEESLLRNPDLTLILVSHHLSEERKAKFTKVYHLDPIPAA